jgi:putative ABC transport system substrate-binding protein
MNAFRNELKRLGYVEGRDVTIEARWADYKADQLASLAAELVKLNPAVIFTGTIAAVGACKKATTAIPIVFATAAQPVELGFVESLRRPGGNITGVILHPGMAAKVLEIAREALPRIHRLAILIHEPDPAHKAHIDSFMGAAKQLTFDPIVVRANQVEELGLAFNEILGQKAEALYLPELSFVRAHSRYLIERSIKARLPLLSGFEEITADGGLLSYDSPREENFRRSAVMVDKILRGAKPGDLPVEQPERFQLVVNLKTAKAIGITVPQSILLRAKRVIE